MSESAPKIVKRVAVGGTAELLLVTQKDGRKAILKRSLEGATPIVLKKLRREGEVLQSLSCSNVIRCLDIQASGLLLEYVDGVDLGRLFSHLTKRGAALPVNAATYLAEGIYKGLSSIHAAGLVHTDVAPGNILVSQESAVKVADLGLVKPAMAPAPPQSEGTLAYQPPEQLMLESIGPSADLYSAALIIYELITGTLARPFGNLGLMELRAARAKQLPPPSTVRPGISSALDKALLWALEPDPQKRPGSAEHVLQALHGSRDAVALTASVRETLGPVVPAARTAVAQNAQNAQKGAQTFDEPAPTGPTIVPGMVPRSDNSLQSDMATTKQLPAEGAPVLSPDLDEAMSTTHRTIPLEAEPNESDNASTQPSPPASGARKPTPIPAHGPFYEAVPVPEPIAELGPVLGHAVQIAPQAILQPSTEGPAEGPGLGTGPEGTQKRPLLLSVFAGILFTGLAMMAFIFMPSPKAERAPLAKTPEKPKLVVTPHAVQRPEQTARPTNPTPNPTKKPKRKSKPIRKPGLPKKPEGRNKTTRIQVSSLDGTKLLVTGAGILKEDAKLIQIVEPNAKMRVLVRAVRHPNDVRLTFGAPRNTYYQIECEGRPKQNTPLLGVRLEKELSCTVAHKDGARVKFKVRLVSS